MSILMRSLAAALFVALNIGGVELSSAEDVVTMKLDRLRAAYPGVKVLEAGAEDESTASFGERVKAPKVIDILHDDYPATIDFESWPVNLDPGRYRNEALLKAVYGQTKNEVEENLVAVKFLDTVVRFQSRNGAAEALKKVASDAEALVKRKPELKRYFRKMGGTFRWRTIAGTHRLSSHSFGLAIDLNPALGGYWQWSDGTPEEMKSMKRRHAYPKEIVQIFEKHGFIWGGKWYHFDLMHFEYRPEFFPQPDATREKK